MIRLSLGKLGSGKSVCEVREMVRHKHKIYSNIQTKFPHQVDISADMIISTDKIGEHKDGRPINKYRLNSDFWKGQKKPLSIVLDEAHQLCNPRRAMSSINLVFGDFLAMARRICDDELEGEGELVLISQFLNRLDIYARQSANEVRYHVSHFTKFCPRCKKEFRSNSEMPVIPGCDRCSYPFRKKDFSVQVWQFQGVEEYLQWHDMGMKSYYNSYLVTDIEQFFPIYRTLQWENMLSKFY